MKSICSLLLPYIKEQVDAHGTRRTILLTAPKPALDAACDRKPGRRAAVLKLASHVALGS